MPRVKPPRGGRRQRPETLHADKAYHGRPNRERLRRRRSTARIARPGVESKERLGRHRWKVERTCGWRNRFRRLKVRSERLEATHHAFLPLACSLIALRRIEGRF